MIERPPHVALVDFHLRGGNSSGLIAHLRKEGVPVIMLSGSFEFPAPVSPEGVTMVEKPISEAQILQYLKPILKSRSAMSRDDRAAVNAAPASSIRCSRLSNSRVERPRRASSLARPQLAKLMKTLQPGDVVIVGRPSPRKPPLETVEAPAPLAVWDGDSKAVGANGKPLHGAAKMSFLKR